MDKKDLMNGSDPNSDTEQASNNNNNSSSNNNNRITSLIKVISYNTSVNSLLTKRNFTRSRH